MSTSYRNPIIPGFAPDPSVVYVDGTYYLVNSSFHVFPGLPIYASNNLTSWTLIGNAINRPSQLSLKSATTQVFPAGENNKVVVTGGLYAPTIRYNKGTFYIICTNVVFDDSEEHFQNFYLSTTDILAGQWSDITRFDFHGIDPSLFFDDDGAVYVQGSFVTDFSGKFPPVIKQFQIDIETGKPVSELREIWQGAAKRDTEGPHLYKKDGCYYLLVAEGGTFEHHMVSIARSTNVWGPYDSFHGNPVLTADGTNEEIQQVGHADMFADQDGVWWAVALGVRNRDGRYPMGRESFLTPVKWSKEGWPMFTTIKTEMERPEATARSSEAIPYSKDAEYLFIRQPSLDNYKISNNPSRIDIIPSRSDLSADIGQVSFIGKRQRSLQGEASVVLHLEGKSGQSLKAGLAVYKDSYRHAEIFYDFGLSALCTSVTNKVTGVSESHVLDSGHLDVSSGTINLRISLGEDGLYELGYQEPSGHGWTALDVVDSRVMTGLDFTGTIFGLFAIGDGERGSVDFRDFSSS